MSETTRMWVSSIVSVGNGVVMAGAYAFAMFDDRNSPAGSGLRTPGPDLRVQVERQDRAMLLVLAPRLARDAPHDLELVAVRVVPVQGLRDPVVRRATERAHLGQDPCRAGEVLDGRDLPRQVIEPDRSTRGARRVRTDREQSEIVVIGAAGRPHEDGLATHLVGDDLEAEDPAVELCGDGRVADEQDGVVET